MTNAEPRGAPGSTMRAVVCHGPEDYRLEAIPIPTPGAGEALIRVEAVGICASDLKCYHGAAKFWGDDDRPAYVEAPVVPGHEFVGEVGVERATITFEAVVVIAGCGPIGLGMVAGAAAKSPAELIALDMVPDKLELAKRCGATRTVNVAEQDPVAIVRELTGGYGADVYLEGSGHPAAVPQGLNLLRKLGTFVEYSVFGSDVTVDWSIISDDKELDVRGAHLGPYCWPAAIRMLESGILPMDQICSRQLPLDRFQDGRDLVAEGSRSIKVTLLPA